MKTLLDLTNVDFSNTQEIEELWKNTAGLISPDEQCYFKAYNTTGVAQVCQHIRKYPSVTIGSEILPANEVIEGSQYINHQWSEIKFFSNMYPEGILFATRLKLDRLVKIHNVL